MAGLLHHYPSRLSNPSSSKFFLIIKRLCTKNSSKFSFLLTTVADVNALACSEDYAAVSKKGGFPCLAYNIQRSELDQIWVFGIEVSPSQYTSHLTLRCTKDTRLNTNVGSSSISSGVETFCSKALFLGTCPLYQY